MTKILFVCHGIQKPDGGVFHEGHCASRGAGKAVRDSVRGDEPRGDRKPCVIRLRAGRSLSTAFPVRAARQGSLRERISEEYDLIIGMDSENERGMRLHSCGDGDAEKIRLLMDYTDRPGDVADPVVPPVTLKQPGAMCPMAAAPF